MIDYGVLVFCDGVLINENIRFQDMEKEVGWRDNIEGGSFSTIAGNNFAYIGNEKITFAFYKVWCAVAVNKQKIVDLYIGDSCRKSAYFNYDTGSIHIKEIDPRIYLASTLIEGKHYNIIYGYGIDTNMDIWNKVKIRYLEKKSARKVDKLIQKYWYKR